MPKNYSDKSQSKLREMVFFSAAWKPKPQGTYHKTKQPDQTNEN